MIKDMVGALRPDRVKRRNLVMGSAVFLLLAGGLIVVLIPVVISVVSAVVSGVAAAVDDEDED